MLCLCEMMDQKYPQFNTISPQHLLKDALYQMCYENAEYLIVLEGEQFIGLLTEHDVAHKLLFAEKQLSELKVGEFMSRNLPVADCADSLEYAMQLLDHYNTRYMAIYDGFTFKGIVSENDLLKQAVKSKRLGIEPAGGQAYPWNY